MNSVIHAKLSFPNNHVLVNINIFSTQNLK